MRTSKRRSTRKGRTRNQGPQRGHSRPDLPESPVRGGTKGTLRSTPGVARTRTREGLCLL